MNYSEFQLDSRLMANIQALNYTETTPIQTQAIPPILKGQDVAGLAQTGTGKTAAFLIPLIERILKAETDPQSERAFKDWKPFQSILVMVPTRELAEQIHENALKFIAGTGLKSYPFYGGTGYEKQKEALANGVNFMISTPGRLIDLYKEHHVDFKRVRAIVFDEADRMFDMGFKEDMKYVLSRVEKTRQFLVFSATLNFDVLNTAYQFGSEPVEINVSRDQAKAENVKDSIFHVGDGEKPQFLVSIIKREKPRQTIVFTNYKSNVDRITNFLSANGIPAMGISSLISQVQRNRALEQFKGENDQNVLVATDVAARGLDILGVDIVVNYEMPQDPESYVHRIGRTGRAGSEGQAFSLVSDKDVESLSRVEDFTKKKIEVGHFEDADLVKDLKPMGYATPFRDRPGQGQRDGAGPRRQGAGRDFKKDGGRPQQRDFKPRDQQPRDGQPREFSKDGGNRDAGGAQGKPREFNRSNGPQKFNRNSKSGAPNRNGKFEGSPNQGNRQGQPQQNGPRPAPVAAAKSNGAQAPAKKGQFRKQSGYRTTSAPVGLVASVKSFFKKIMG